MGQTKKCEKRIRYSPPSRQTVDQYAHGVCEQLAKRKDSYRAPSVIAGFARFVELAGQIMAKHLNGESETGNKLDSKSE